MSLDQKAINLLSEIKTLLASNQSDYCDSDEACRIIGVNNYRYLAQLHQRDLLTRYPRGDGYKYKKADLYKIAGSLDKGEIVLIPLNKRKKCA